MNDALIVARIHDAMHRAIMDGYAKSAKRPMDLWMGPAERKELCQWLEHTGISRASRAGEEVYRVGLVCDGKSQFEGMTIRFMRNDGLRVGVSYESVGPTTPPPSVTQVRVTS